MIPFLKNDGDLQKFDVPPPSKLVLIEQCPPQNQTNCHKNEIRILFRSRDIQVDHLKWDTLYIGLILDK